MGRRGQRQVIGFYTDEKGRVRPVTMRYPLSFKARRAWIIGKWHWGRRGSIDWAKAAMRRIPAEKNPIAATMQVMKGISPLQDIHGYEHPRVDILPVKTKAGTTFHVGSNRVKVREQLQRWLKRVLDMNFTREEIKALKGVYVEARKALPYAAGTCEAYPTRHGKRFIITVDPKYAPKPAELEFILTHELVHARRNAAGESVMDRDRNEKETELETVARVSKQALKALVGYYQHVPKQVQGMDLEEWMEHAKSHDRLLVTGGLKNGGLEKQLKGKRLLKRLKEVYDQSLISEAHFSPGEELDRYFKVKVGKVQLNLHVRFQRAVSLRELRKMLRERYGPQATVWEYKDGRKTLILKGASE